MTPSQQWTDFDPHAPEHANDPIASFNALRRGCPVSWSTRHGGFWVATGYGQVATVARDPATFSSAPVDGRSVQIPPTPHSLVMPPLELDPPEFAAYRQLLMPRLTPTAVAAMEPRIQTHVDACLERVATTGHLEVMGDLALPVPAIVTLELLGMPTTDWEYFSRTFHLMTDEHGAGRPEAIGQGLEEMEAVVRNAVQDRRRHPSGDLLSVVSNADLDTGPVTEDLAVGTALLLIAGGVNTTADLTAHALVHLASRGEIHADLVSDDRTMRMATEEFLRFVSPILSFPRRAVAEADLDGCPVRPGQPVLMSWAGANHDESRFEKPGELRLDRWPNPHLAFGAGPHRCIGSNLARTMFRLMVRGVLTTMPGYQVDSVVGSTSRGTHHHLSEVWLSSPTSPRPTG